jgi:biopolymer transport protein ExbD
LRLSQRCWDCLPVRELALINTIGATLVLLIVLVLGMAYGLPGGDFRAAVAARAPGLRSDDSETLEITIIRSGNETIYQVGSRRIAAREELLRVLRPLVDPRTPIFVRVSDDVDFTRALLAMQACHEAGFRSIAHGTVALPAGSGSGSD